MTITRNINGETVEIVLTDAEMYQAYRIQEHAFQLSDMAYRLECFENDEVIGDFAKSIIDDPQALEYVAKVYQHYYDRREDGDFEYSCAVDAIQKYQEHMNKRRM